MSSENPIDQLLDGQRVRAGQTILPGFLKGTFHCQWCQVFARQRWDRLELGGVLSPIQRCRCSNCGADSYWLYFEATKSSSGSGPLLLYPRTASVQVPHPEMPEDVRKEYDEAASIIDASPRGAGALLRLALQKLMPHLGEEGKNINEDIASLVAKGLDPDVQQALDALRVIGNNAVHPGELDLRDDTATVGAMFGVLNFIIEERIARPKKLEALYLALPEGARQAIDRRDAR